MKKYLIAFFFGISLIPTNTFANITFDLNSPQNIGTEINIYGDIGDTIFIVDDNDNVIGGGSNFPANQQFTGSETRTYSFIECDSTAIDAVCSGFATGEQARNDTGFIDEKYFTWEISPVSLPMNEAWTNFWYIMLYQLQFYGPLTIGILLLIKFLNGDFT